MGDLPVADIATREIHVGMGVDLNILGRYCKKSFKQLTIHPTFFPIFDRRDQNILASLFAPDALLHITSSGSGHIEFFHQLVSFVGILGSSFSGFKVDWSYQTKFRNIPRDLLDSVSSWNHLKEFHYSGANPAALSTLWPKVGSSLVNLKVSIPRKDNNLCGKWSQLLHHVGIHCRNLTSVMFSDPCDDRKERNACIELSF